MTTVSNTDASTMSNTANQQAKSQIGADFNMFLKLLTTQMQNQDPLDPMDTSEYTQQLVQFSAVEQSMQQTDALKDILARLTGQDMAQSSSYIGREGRFDSATSGLSGDTPATWTYAMNGAPTTIKATVKDANGNVVKEVVLPAEETQGRYSWDGTKSDGSKAADGAYTLSISAIDAKGATVPVTINSVGTVREVVTNGDSVVLSVNGLRYPLESLVAVAAPGGAEAEAE